MAVGNRESCRHRSGNHNQRRFRSAGNGRLFDNSLNIEGLRLKGLMENGYEEGCTRGATPSEAAGISAAFFYLISYVLGLYSAKH